MGCHEDGRRDFGNDLPRLPTECLANRAATPRTAARDRHHDRQAAAPASAAAPAKRAIPAKAITERAGRSRTICNGAAGKSALSS